MDRNVLTELFKLVQLGNEYNFVSFIQTHFNGENSWGIQRHQKSGSTVACVAADHGHVSILSLCRDVDLERGDKDGKRPLHIAAQQGQLECVEYLLSRNVDVDCLKRADWTPLMLACTKDRLDIIIKLVEAGANVSLVNKDGWNCFHVAAREGHDAIVNYLLDTKLDLCKTTSNNGRTPLHTAALHGNLGVVRTLLNRCRCEPDPVDSCGTTPLMNAFTAGHVTIGRALIEHGADASRCDKVGRSPLHLAAQAGCDSSIRYLVEECEIDVNQLTSNSCDTALHFAAKEGHVNAVSLLLSLGADRSLCNHKLRTALDVAGGPEDCVQKCRAQLSSSQ